MSHTLLLAHGSRDPQWCQPFIDLVDALQREDVSLAFMELASPSLSEAVDQLVALNIRHLRILPLFFAAGRHLREDVPLEIQRLQMKYPHISLELLAPVGQHPVMQKALAQVITGA